MVVLVRVVGVSVVAVVGALFFVAAVSVAAVLATEGVVECW